MAYPIKMNVPNIGDAACERILNAIKTTKKNPVAVFELDDEKRRYAYSHLSVAVYSAMTSSFGHQLTKGQLEACKRVLGSIAEVSRWIDKLEQETTFKFDCSTQEQRSQSFKRLEQFLVSQKVHSRRKYSIVDKVTSIIKFTEANQDLLFAPPRFDQNADFKYFHKWAREFECRVHREDKYLYDWKENGETNNHRPINGVEHSLIRQLGAIYRAVTGDPAKSSAQKSELDGCSKFGPFDRMVIQTYHEIDSALSKLNFPFADERMKAPRKWEEPNPYTLRSKINKSMRGKHLPG